MLNVNMLTAVFAKTLQEHVSLLRGFQWVDEWIFTAREIIVLDVDEEEGCINELSPEF